MMTFLVDDGSESKCYFYSVFTLFYCCNAFCLIQYVACSILNKLTPEKFDLLKGQLIDSGITSADILKVV